MTVTLCYFFAFVDLFLVRVGQLVLDSFPFCLMCDSVFALVTTQHVRMPSVLWRCWLGDRKDEWKRTTFVRLSLAWSSLGKVGKLFHLKVAAAAADSTRYPLSVWFMCLDLHCCGMETVLLTPLRRTVASYPNPGLLVAVSAGTRAVKRCLLQTVLQFLHWGAS